MTTSTLVVAIRGWTNTGDRLLGGRPGAEFPPQALQALQAELPDAQVWAPPIDLPMFCMRSAESVARELFAAIDAKVRATPGLESIVLLGYSAGSLLVRRVFCIAHGADDRAVLSNTAAPWAGKINRLVMLAGITRGWEFSTASPDHVRFLGPVLQRVARLVGWFKGLSSAVESRTPFIWQLKRGAPFVTTTRIQYIHVLEALRQARDAAAYPHPGSPLRMKGLPSTVFLLGARDEYISPADCTELGPRDEFAFIELGGSNHSEALLIEGDDPERSTRRQRLAAAVAEGFDRLVEQPWAVPSGDIDDYLDPMDLAANGATGSSAAARVEHAVLVVHGIRDNGFWTKRVAREIKTLARRSGIEARAPTPSYGYFSMWDFVKPGGREKAAFWFMERYADVKSHFPNARISFVGHSNGTYIAARALELCPAIHFDHVVFAGSVVRRNYAWARFSGRVGAVLNYVGSADSVVAFLPAVFEFLRLKWLDVGGAGAFGFDEAAPPPALRRALPSDTAGAPVELTELRFVAGGHGAAIGESFWPEIARFVLLDQLPERMPAVREDKTHRLFRWAPAITGAGVCFAAALLTLPLSVAAGYVAYQQGSSLGDVVTVALFVLVGMAVSWLCGRFLKAW